MTEDTAVVFTRGQDSAFRPRPKPFSGSEAVGVTGGGKTGNDPDGRAMLALPNKVRDSLKVAAAEQGVPMVRMIELLVQGYQEQAMLNKENDNAQG